MKDHLHTIGDRFAKLVVDEPDEDAAKRQEPDQIPEVFRPDSGTGIKSARMLHQRVRQGRRQQHLRWLGQKCHCSILKCV